MLATIGWGTMALAAALVVGAVGGLVAVAAHESDAAFVYHQQHPREIEATEMATVVAQAREPVPGNHGTRAVHVECSPGHEDAGRHNPWTCRTRYESGRRVRYVIEIAPNGSWRGINRRGDREVSGCCFAVGE